MTTTGAAAQTVPASTERYIPGEGAKRNSITQDVDMQRKERSFQECLEFLLPAYLLPFMFNDREGTSIYCILLTVLGLMGRLLPPAVAAMLPIVILPLGDAYSAERVAAEYMGPCVLAASLLFAIAFLCDETTVFFRLSLHALRRYALRMQPLFLYMHLLVFGLSLLLPSHLIVVFSTVFIERFVTTVHNEIVGNADQRSSVVRIQSASSSLNYFDEGRRSRWAGGRMNIALGRKARSVSMVSEMTAASDVSAGSSLVRQYRMHPPAPLPDQATVATPRSEKTARKTSFGTFERATPLDQDWPYHVPVRRIRSFSQDPKPPSSILKRSPAVPPPSPLASATLCPQSSPVPSPLAAIAGSDDTAMATLLTGAHSTPSSPRSPSPSTDDLLQQEGPYDSPVSPSSTAETPMLCSLSPPATPLRAPLSSLATSPGAVEYGYTTDTAYNATPGASRQLSIVDTAVAGTSTPRVFKGRGERSPSPRRTRAKVAAAAARRMRDRELASPEKTAEDNLEARNRHQSSSYRYTRQPEPAVRQPTVTTVPVPRSDARPTPLQMPKPKIKPLPEQKIQPGLEQAAQPKPEMGKLDTKPEAKAERRAEPEPEPKAVEVRGVLKKRNLSLQPSVASRNGSVPYGRLLSPFDDQFNLVAQCPLPTTELTGQEQQSSSLRVRALISAARPAFIAGAAYAAIFGNLASFSTLPTRRTVLVTLGCDDEIDEQTHEDMSKCARARQRNMKKHTMREALLFYWLVGIPVASSAYATRHPEGYGEGPFLGLTLLVLSTAPGSTWRRCWSFRLLCWRKLCSRMPWNIILMLGSVMVLTKTVEVQAKFIYCRTHVSNRRRGCRFAYVAA